jgi:AcrR family transcriptional regulator
MQSSRQRVPRSIREQQMLDAAVIEFARHGFHAASMDDIAARSNVSKPMVYAYLGTKDDLFIACLHREGTRLMEAIIEVVDARLGLDEQLWHGVNAFFGFVAANRDGWSVLYRQEHGRYASDRNQMRARMVEVVASMLTRAVISGGSDAKSQDMTAMSYALVGACESVADWLVDHPEESSQTAAKRLMNIVWIGAERLLGGAHWQSPTESGH